MPSNDTDKHPILIVLGVAVAVLALVATGMTHLDAISNKLDKWFGPNTPEITDPPIKPREDNPVQASKNNSDDCTAPKPPLPSNADLRPRSSREGFDWAKPHYKCVEGDWQFVSGSWQRKRAH